MSLDDGLWIRGRCVSDKFEGKADKLGEYDYITETKLGLEPRSLSVLRRLLPAPYIGGRVPKSWRGDAVRC
jgi:hypothetical protein